MLRLLTLKEHRLHTVAIRHYVHQFPPVSAQFRQQLVKVTRPLPAIRICDFSLDQVGTEEDVFPLVHGAHLMSPRLQWRIRLESAVTFGLRVRLQLPCLGGGGQPGEPLLRPLFVELTPPRLDDDLGTLSSREVSRVATTRPEVSTPNSSRSPSGSHVSRRLARRGDSGAFSATSADRLSTPTPTRPIAHGCWPEVAPGAHSRSAKI